MNYNNNKTNLQLYIKSNNISDMSRPSTQLEKQHLSMDFLNMKYFIYKNIIKIYI